MMSIGSMTQKISLNPLRGFAIFLFLFVFVFLLWNQDLLRFNFHDNPAINLNHATPASTFAPPVSSDFCTFGPLSPADAKEERLILDSIAWPETPVLPSPVLLNQTSDPAHSTFTILPRRGGGEWHVGDRLEVLIKMFDFQGRPKKTGGDFLLARLHNRTLKAGVAGRVVDHLNGSYSAVFPLLWEGSAQIEVMLVHPSEAITVLRRMSKEHPDRVFFKSFFRSGSVTEASICNVCLRRTGQPQCNFTDLRTGEPWFCYKPKNLSCDVRVNHMRVEKENKSKLKDKEDLLFQKRVNLKIFIGASGLSSVTVSPQMKGHPGVAHGDGDFRPSGYYYQDKWKSLVGTKVQQFNNASAISQCLKGKMVHLYGDSTIRQWFEYLNQLPGGNLINLNGVKQVGPFMMWDNIKKILVTYRCHGPPLSYTIVPTSDLRYISNELDGLTGGINTVVALSIWAHFSPFPIEIYLRRLQSIRSAVVRLLNRAPGTLVVIRTGNLRGVDLDMVLGYSDWYAFQRDKVLRAVFRGVSVHMVDAWEMTVAHYLPHNIHPQNPILKNLVDVLLSHICHR